jgi:hypothetical protein
MIEVLYESIFQRPASLLHRIYITPFHPTFEQTRFDSLLQAWSVAVDLRTGTQRILVRGGSQAPFVPNGPLVDAAPARCARRV